jgi:beta-lactam-binding protein with PASTA domain
MVRKPKNVTAATGEVVKQIPRSGMELAAGTSVDITLSK